MTWVQTGNVFVRNAAASERKKNRASFFLTPDSSGALKTNETGLLPYTRAMFFINQTNLESLVTSDPRITF